MPAKNEKKLSAPPMPEEISEILDFARIENISLGEDGIDGLREKVYTTIAASLRREAAQEEQEETQAEASDATEEAAPEPKTWQDYLRLAWMYLRQAKSYVQGSLPLWAVLNALYLTKITERASGLIPAEMRGAGSGFGWLRWVFRLLTWAIYALTVAIIIPPTRNIVADYVDFNLPWLYVWYEDWLWMVHVAFIALVLLRLGILALLRYVRERNLTTIQLAQESDGGEYAMRTIQFNPRADDKTKWREAYPAFWREIHAAFKRSDRDVLLAKTPYAAFEIHRFGAEHLHSRLLDDVPASEMVITAPATMLRRITTRLKSIHTGMRIAPQKRDEEYLRRLVKYESEARGTNLLVKYVDYIPVGGNTASLNLSGEVLDPLKALSVTLSPNKYIIATGIMVLVRDAPNVHGEIMDALRSMTMTPEGKRRSLDALEKAKAKKLETKAQETQYSLTYNPVIRVYAVAAPTPDDPASANEASQHLEMFMQEVQNWIDTIQGDNQLSPINEGDDFESLVERRYPHIHNIMTTVTPSEMAGLWHIPDADDAVGFVDRSSYKMIAPAAAIVKKKGAPNARVLGRYPTSDGEWVEVVHYTDGAKPPAMTHLHVMGPTGVGKSVFALNLIMDDINSVSSATGRPYTVAVLEPHSDLTQDIMYLIPEHRLQDTIIIDPLDPMPPAINLLHTSGNRRALDKEAGAATLSLAKAIDGWESLSRASAYGANAIRLLMAVLPRLGVTPTIVHFFGFISSYGYRQYIFSHIPEEMVQVKLSWADFMAESENAQRQILQPLTFRVNKLLGSVELRRVVAQPRMSIPMRRLIDDGTIILAKLSHELPKNVRSLLGSMVISSISMAALSRSDIPRKQRHPTMFYIDEFQTMLAGNGEWIASLLAEVRKYNMGLTLIHQNLAQITDPTVLAAIINNTLSKAVFRTTTKDAKAMIAAKYEGKLQPSDITLLPKYTIQAAVAALDGDIYYATLNTPPPRRPEEVPDLEFNGKHLLRDAAEALGLPWPKHPNVAAAKDTKDLVAHVWATIPNYAVLANIKAEVQKRGEQFAWPEISGEKLNQIVAVLGALPQDRWNEFWRINEEYQKMQRKLLLEDPAYIRNPAERVAHVSRLRIGTPYPIIDALVNRVYREVDAISQQYGGEDEAASVDGDISLDELLGLGDEGNDKKKSKGKSVAPDMASTDDASAESDDGGDDLLDLDAIFDF